MNFPLTRWLTLLICCGALAHCPAGDAPVYTNAWKLSFRSPINSGAALAQDGTIYFGTFGGEFIALQPDGQFRWKFKTGSEIIATPSVAPDGTIYFGCRDHYLYALTPAGSLKWRFRTGGWVDTSPALGADGTIHFGSWDKKFYALNPDGTKRWAFVTDGEVTGSAAIATDGTIYFGSHDKKCYALRPDGTKRWAFSTAGEIIASPAIGEHGMIYLNSTDGRLYALNPDGTRQWAVKIGSHTKSSPVIDANGNLYAAGAGAIVSVDAAGKKRWTVPLISDLSAWATPVISADGRVFIYQQHGGMAAFTFEGRQLLDAWVDDGPAENHLTISPEGLLLAGANCGSFTAIKIAAPPANSSWPMFQRNAQHTGRAPR